MASNLLNKYVWLVETIYRAKQITFNELREKWLDNELSEGVELPLRTFHKWRIAVEEMFGLVIDCQRKGGYHYYIANAEELKGGNIRNWLLNTVSVSNLLIDNQHLKDRILLENIPSGQQYLADIIGAMKCGSTLTVTYQNYWHDEAHTFDIEPYCVKLFKQRWYVVGRTPYYDQVRIYSLDRILDLFVSNDKRFKMPKTFSSEEYFEQCYGIEIGKDIKPEKVKLKVSAGQANYLRSLPLHHSQQEIETTEEYSIFELKLRPTYDFQQEILRNGDDIEVLEPLWFRNEIVGRIEKMCVKYKK
jgi:hypothetical protein